MFENFKDSLPNILVVNDDGITAPGIRALIKFMKPFGNILVVAPNQSMSGMGHAITINSTLRLNQYNGGEGVVEFACSGTPVDCVKFGAKLLGDKKIDLVVSGINHGSNSSINVIYSGTMSAAIEGAIEGIPAIGFSLCNHRLDIDFSACETIVQTIVKKVLEEKKKCLCLNVNIPYLPKEEIKGIKTCRQAKAYWREDFEERHDPNGQTYYWLKGSFVNEDSGEDTDVWALDNGYVSVVPVQFDLTNYNVIQLLNNW